MSNQEGILLSLKPIDPDTRSQWAILKRLPLKPSQLEALIAGLEADRELLEAENLLRESTLAHIKEEPGQQHDEAGELV